ncbi:MAG: arylsulfotransferase family protein [Myxococcota bacterium]|nr:arylsulfotransferase family protein [Myxococcota bacterium]
MPARAALFLAPLAAWLLACHSGEEEAAPLAPAIDAQQEEMLARLGYIDFAEEEAGGEHGVVVFDRERTHPGYNLYAIRSLCRAELIDMAGRLVNAWEHAPCGFWSNPELLPNGDLLITGSDPADASRESRIAAMYLMRLGWDGEVIWKRRVAAHHDVERTPRGQLLTLTSRFRRIPAVHRGAWIEDNSLALLTPDGELVEDASFFDLLRAAPDRFRLQRLAVLERDGALEMDLFHANSVEWMDHPGLAGEHPLYAPSNLLTCVRNQDSIVVIDWDRKRLVWAWGRGVLSRPHHPTVIENGNILVFDNGPFRRWSRVVEVDPRRDEIVWEYRAPRPEDFFSGGRGSNQRLPNGNTLIADSDSGRAFEVTREGEIVWEFLTPHIDDEGHRATIIRMRRYEPAFVEAMRGG